MSDILGRLQKEWTMDSETGEERKAVDMKNRKTETVMSEDRVWCVESVKGLSREIQKRLNTEVSGVLILILRGKKVSRRQENSSPPRISQSLRQITTSPMTPNHCMKAQPDLTTHDIMQHFREPWIYPSCLYKIYNDKNGKRPWYDLVNCRYGTLYRELYDLE